MSAPPVPAGQVAEAPWGPDPWYVGQEVGQVVIEAATGELPPENLLPLLGLQPGGTLDLAAIRNDLELLLGLGLFRQVEADVSRGVAVDPEGRPREVVWLTWRVLPAPVVRRVQVRGARRLRPADVREAAGLRAGRRLGIHQDVAGIAASVARRYAEAGFPRAEAAVSIDEVEPGVVDVRIRVEEGDPERVVALEVVGEGAVPARRMRRILARQGVMRRWILRPDALERALGAVADAWRKEGYLGVRVRGVLAPAEGGVALTVVVEPGSLVTLEVRGSPWLRPRAAWRALEMDRREGVTRWDLPEMEEALRREFVRRGWPDARVQLALHEIEGEVRLVAEVEPGRRVRLARRWLVVEGDNPLGERGLRGAMAAAAPETLGRGRVSAEDLDRALDLARDALRARGYLDADIQLIERRRTPGILADREQVRVRVEAGAPTVLGALELVGLPPDVELGLQGEVDALPGSAYRPREVQRIGDRAAAELREMGYLDATARVEVRRSDDGREVRVRVVVDPGVRAALRLVIVRGLRRTRRTLVEQAIPLETGDFVSPSALTAIRRRLYAMGLFQRVDVRLVGEDPHWRDLIVEVVEMPALQVELGGGISTDEGLRVFARAARTNLLGRGHRTEGRFQVGLGYSGDNWRFDLDSPEYSAALAWIAPLGRFQVRGEALLGERQQEPTFRWSRSGGSLGVDLLRGDRRQLSIRYRLEHRWLEAVDPGALVGGESWWEHASTLARGEAAGPRQVGGPSLQALWDARDDRFNPTRGLLASFALDAYDPWSTPDGAGLRAEGSAALIVPVGGHALHLAMLVGAGWREGRNTTLAVEDRFRLGGAGTLRGFALDSVGPRNEVARLDLAWPDALDPEARGVIASDPTRWVPTGGDAMILLSGEWWSPLERLGLERWSGVSLIGFLDVGGVTFLDPGIVVSSGLTEKVPLLRTGAGVGLRYRTPVGPIQLDLGLNPSWFTNTWAAEQGETPWQVHFALGSL